MNVQSLFEKASSCYGCLSELKTTESRRRHPPEEDEDRLDVKNPFQKDKSKLLLSKAYRVLWKKTQVFSIPESPLTRTRMTHVMEVVGNCITASELLGLNTDLVEAAAIGHDIGHVPYGHPGEEWMKNNLEGLAGFCHEKMGVVTAQKIERAGRGLNLTWHTLEAMMCHSGNMAREGMSQEAWLLNYMDKITYLFHDYNDIFNVERANYPKPLELEKVVNSFGSNQRERTNTTIAGLVIESAQEGKVSFRHSELGQRFQHLRALMYKVYYRVTKQDVGKLMKPAYDFLKEQDIGDPSLLLALSTDGDVLSISRKDNVNSHDFKLSTVFEIVPRLEKIYQRHGKIDLCNPDLDTW
ncbi:MAG: hypothetical protein A3F47_02440 [Candidatus Staskawiczbacteria bacterium RIFCSPHIGHO2_12_FULL_38_11]|uniref:HD domain-containing protein n=1 Tax=Candidatus Staskawiczbacteria bacterium RIFCSPHIGHO2_12_FULL_38_11 TaxID=1802209 RepID=A0A1G2I5B7_9BACT|nr:MAG: hypothetical protein A3F47_02440 [Candidatus Staskawiczbacteria bacterium RIFCSPHIGHO2_12_FULL_38_11]